MKFVADFARTFIRSEGVDTFVLTPVIRFLAFINFDHEPGREPGFLNCSVRNEFNLKLVRRRSDIRWNFVTAISTQDGGVRSMPISNFDIIVDATVVVFDLKNIKTKRCYFPSGELDWLICIQPTSKD